MNKAAKSAARKIALALRHKWRPGIGPVGEWSRRRRTSKSARTHIDDGGS